MLAIDIIRVTLYGLRKMPVRIPWWTTSSCVSVPWISPLERHLPGWLCSRITWPQAAGSPTWISDCWVLCYFL